MKTEKDKVIGFVVTSMAAGFLASIGHFAVSIPGALMGGGLAVGVLVCRAHYKSQGTLSVVKTLMVATAISFALSLLIMGYRILLFLLFSFFQKNLTHILLEIENIGIKLLLGTWLNCLLISWGVFLLNRSYLLKQGRLFWKVLLFFVLMPSLGMLPRFAPFYTPSTGPEELPELKWIIIPCMWGGLMLFLLLWGGVARWYGFFRKETHEETDVKPEPPASETERSDA